MIRLRRRKLPAGIDSPSGLSQNSAVPGLACVAEVERIRQARVKDDD